MLKDLVLKNRSYRAFKAGEEIPEEALLRFVELARNCPSARNAQPIKYRLVTAAEERDAVLPHTYWAGSLGLQLPPIGHAPTAYIILCHDTTVCPINPFSEMDVGIAAQTIMLAAAEEGFGGCMIGSVKGEAVAAALNIPDHLNIRLALALGVPDETVILTSPKEGSVRYYRDEENRHYVPKRPMEDILI